MDKDTKQRIGILSFSNIARDSRIKREVEAARGIYQVDVIGFGDWKPPEGVRFFRLNRTPRNLEFQAQRLCYMLAGKVNPGFWDRFYWRKHEYERAREILLREDYDLIHANDWDSLPTASSAVRIKKNMKLLFDAHEYSIEDEADNLIWKFLVAPYIGFMLRSYQDAITGIITVSEGIKELYQQNFGWESSVIMNATHYTKIDFRPVDPENIHLVHHGGAVRTRHIDKILRMISLLDKRYSMNFILLPTQPAYLEDLKRTAKQIAPDRVRFWEPLASEQIVRELVRYDIGIPLLHVKNLSNFNALPNKFFDFIMSGLAVVVSPLPMMKMIVDEHQIGVVSPDQSMESMARRLNDLTPDQINQYKKNSLELAKTLNAEKEMEKLLQIYHRFLSH